MTQIYPKIQSPDLPAPRFTGLFGVPPSRPVNRGSTVFYFKFQSKITLVLSNVFVQCHGLIPTDNQPLLVLKCLWFTLKPANNKSSLLCYTHKETPDKKALNRSNTSISVVQSFFVRSKFIMASRNYNATGINLPISHIKSA